MRRFGGGVLALAVALASALCVVPAAGAATPDPGIALEPVLNSQTPGVGNFHGITDVVSPPGDPGRLLVVQREGLISQVVNGQTSTFLDLTPKVAFIEGFKGYEKGLWSLAFPADYQTSHSFWAVFTRELESGETEDPDIELAEFKTDSGGAVVAGSERLVAVIPHPTIHHYGGQIAFGPEGDLYWSVGDGSVSVSPAEFTKPQDLTNPLGKILRINPRQNGLEAFQIPPGNPYAGSANPYTRAIWAYGLRNPWRFSIDRATGTMAIGDVGNLEHEEVDLVRPEGGYRAGRGDNFGWPCREGAHEAAYEVDATDGCPLAPPFVDPVFDYEHKAIEGSSHKACAVMGGVIAGAGAPAAIDGRYLYADHCTGQIRSLDPNAVQPGTTDRLEIELPTKGPKDELSGEPNDFGTDSCGHVYVGTNLGYVYRIAGTGETLGCPHPEAPGAPEDPMAAEGPAPVEPNPPGGGGTGGSGGAAPTNGGSGSGGNPGGGGAPRPRAEQIDLSIVAHVKNRYRLRAHLTPCAGDGARTVVLRAEGQAIGRRVLTGTCTATFALGARRKPRSVKATVEASESWAGAVSAPLRLAARR